MANFFIGDEIKFAINLQAEGFSMDSDDFDVKITHPGGSIEGSKSGGGSTDGKLVIFREPAATRSLGEQTRGDVVPVPGSDSSDGDTPSGGSDSSEESTPTTGTWFCIVDTEGFKKGDLKVIATAYVLDAKASGGSRKEIATATYGQGQNP